MPDRCWICLSEEGTDWKKVCPCNLYAHELCILKWSEFTGEGEELKCPQCQTPIRIDHGKSAFVEFQDIVQRALNQIVGGGIVSLAVPAIATNVVYNTLYEVGAMSVRVMCSPGLAGSILGPLWTKSGRLAPLGEPIFSFSPFSIPFSYPAPLGVSQTHQQLHHHIYRLIGLPAIPVWLCSSGKYSTMAGGAFAAIISNIPGPDQGPLLGFLAARYTYQLLWDLAVPRFLGSLARKLFDARGGEDPNVQFYRLVRNAWRLRTEVANPDQEQQHITELNEALEEIKKQRTYLEGAWLLSHQSGFVKVTQGLVVPYLSSLVGKLLLRVPKFASYTTLKRNLVGFCLLVVARDFLRLLGAYRRYKNDQNKRVLGYGDPELPQTALIKLTRFLDRCVPDFGNILSNLGVEVAIL